MREQILNKISQIEYEISLIGKNERDQFTGIENRLDELKGIINGEVYSKDDMIESAEYGYNYHVNTSFPSKNFEENCKNNFLQHLWAKNRNK